MDLPGRWWIVAFGKASVAMGGAAVEELERVGARIAGGVVVSNEENLAAVEGEPRGRGFMALALRRGGHPLPDADSVRAGLEVERTLRAARQGDRVLVLISGGGSALVAAPAVGLTLEAKIATTRQLLEGGADIRQVNCVRKHLSRLKGGRLAVMAYPARVEALVLSDVVGDDLSTVASGPTVGDETTYEDALAVLDSVLGTAHGPLEVREYLQRGAGGALSETPRPGASSLARTRTRLIGGNGLAVAAMVRRARELGYRVTEWGRPIEGEAREVAIDFVQEFGRCLGKEAERCAMVAGGETTVTVTGGGRGGRNQELALAFAIAADEAGVASPRCWVLLSGGTDGRDGPTDAAGGIVDSGSLMRMRDADVEPSVWLEENDSHGALEASGDLLVTGPTGTNVADLMVLLTEGRAPGSPEGENEDGKERSIPEAREERGGRGPRGVENLRGDDRFGRGQPRQRGRGDQEGRSFRGADCPVDRRDRAE